MSQEMIAAASAVAQISKAVSNQARCLFGFPDLPSSLNVENMARALAEISNWPDYAATPLHSLPAIAAACGVKAVFYKDEAMRFGLGSFKALGGAYAVANLASQYRAAGRNVSELIVATATDGNHGRSVSWGAQREGCAAKIFIHQQVSRARQQAMEDLGAEVIRVKGNYEVSLRVCKEESDAHGWQLVSDTSWNGYRDIPIQVMAGYSVLATETLQQMGDLQPSHAFLPVGVGSLAAGLVARFWEVMGHRLCRIIAVESDMSACLQKSVEVNSPVLFDISEETLMAGLSCGEVSQLAWEILQSTLSHSLSITDGAVAPLMRLLAGGLDGSPSIEAGECSTAGLAALLAAKRDTSLWAELELDADSVVLLIGTEGATDPELYRSVINDVGRRV